MIETNSISFHFNIFDYRTTSPNAKHEDLPYLDVLIIWSCSNFVSNFSNAYIENLSHNMLFTLPKSEDTYISIRQLPLQEIVSLCGNYQLLCCQFFQLSQPITFILTFFTIFFLRVRVASLKQDECNGCD
jgi:hypothetical protein